MSKLVSILAIVIAVSACAFNPTHYEELRKAENLQHDKVMG